MLVVSNNVAIAISGAALNYIAYICAWKAFYVNLEVAVKPT